MIYPTKQDIGRKVRYRDFSEENKFQSGNWIEGKIRMIGDLLVVVEFEETVRELNRVTLYWADA